MVFLDFREDRLGQLEEGTGGELSDDSSCFLQGGHEVVQLVSLLLEFSSACIPDYCHLMNSQIVPFFLPSLISNLLLFISLLFIQKRQLLLIIGSLVCRLGDNSADFMKSLVTQPDLFSLFICFSLLLVLQVISHLTKQVQDSFNTICSLLIARHFQLDGTDDCLTEFLIGHLVKEGLVGKRQGTGR